MELPQQVVNEILTRNKIFRDTTLKVLTYLGTVEGQVTTTEISQALGISKRAVNKALKKLTSEGILQAAKSEKRYWLPKPPPPEAIPIPPPGDYDLLRTRLDSLEESNRLVLEQNQTMMEILVSIQHHINTPEIPKATIPTPEITGTVPTPEHKADSTAPKTDPPYNSLAALAFNNSLASSLQPCDEFQALFGVRIPIGADMLAVNEMISRKKSGKLENVKSPLGYLASISGKVGPVVTTAPSTTGRPMPEMVDMKRIELERRANEMWEKMGDGERKPFLDHAGKVKPSRWNPPIEGLARSEFKRQILLQHGVTI